MIFYISFFFNKKELYQKEIFLLGSQNSLSLKTIAQIIIDKLNSQSTIKYSDKTFHDFDVKIDQTKAVKKLGFKPMTIQEGLDAYIESS